MGVPHFFCPIQPGMDALGNPDDGVGGAPTRGGQPAQK